MLHRVPRSTTPNPEPECMALAIPTVHLNGTSRDDLKAQHLDAIRAGRAFVEKLAAASPNGRDFYVQGPHAFGPAQEQHRARLAKVQEVIKELETIAMGIVR